MEDKEKNEFTANLKAQLGHFGTQTCNADPRRFVAAKAQGADFGRQGRRRGQRPVKLRTSTSGGVDLCRVLPMLYRWLRRQRSRVWSASTKSAWASMTGPSIEMWDAYFWLCCCYNLPGQDKEDGVYTDAFG